MTKIAASPRRPSSSTMREPSDITHGLTTGFRRPRRSEEGTTQSVAIGLPLPVNLENLARLDQKRCMRADDLKTSADARPSYTRPKRLPPYNDWYRMSMDLHAKQLTRGAAPSRAVLEPLIS